ncbi:ABC transporter permease subunit [Aromatoleum toluclasticum]|uniref:PstC family ABC transporter permease n=1 Tax=Aromatoleum toluclasticum TaxID=92003 RepID=UPI001D18FEC1|nr:ABC transporter permease subunit [Aromatoleum toluclasticum]MCC4118133.1 ABC transporter permease subunit [Aromatoleum toluclasticum]
MSPASTSCRRPAADRLLYRALAVSAGAVAAILALILVYLTAASAGLLFADASLWGPDWHPSLGAYGLLAMLAGSVAVSVLALLIAVPPGLVLAVWGRFFAPPWLGGFYRAAMGLLASIPSVVYGFWGLVVLVPVLNRWAPPGASLLAGALVLALMILPILVLQADLALDEARRRHLAAAMALGASVSGTVRRVLLPSAAPQLLPAVLLQLGRALGETMAVLMVAGNVVQLPDAITAPIRTLTANIALEMAYASGAHQTALFASGWLLLVLVTLIMLGARAMAGRFGAGPAGEGRGDAR